MKTVAAPRSVLIERKLTVWTARPRPGPHGIEGAVALSTVLKRSGFAVTKKDVRRLLNSGSVRIDGRVVRDMRLPIGMMDVIEVAGKGMRALLDAKGRISLAETANPRVKLCRVERKHRAKRGKLHITLHDGKCLLDYVCSVGDSVCVSIPEMKPVEHIPLAVGAEALVVRGKHVGKQVRIDSITQGTATRRAEVSFTYGGSQFSTPKEYVFPIKKEYI